MYYPILQLVAEAVVDLVDLVDPVAVVVVDLADLVAVVVLELAVLVHGLEAAHRLASEVADM